MRVRSEGEGSSEGKACVDHVTSLSFIKGNLHLHHLPPVQTNCVHTVLCFGTPRLIKEGREGGKDEGKEGWKKREAGGMVLSLTLT